jgi:hypothetical protein
MSILRFTGVFRDRTELIAVTAWVQPTVTGKAGVAPATSPAT